MSKGKSLRDLTREKPTTEEYSILRRELTNHGDAQLAASTCASVDRELEELIFYRLKIEDEVTIKELTKDDGPLSTLYDKIEFGRAIKLYPDDLAHNLHIVRRIRNVFAHSIRIVSFENPLIIAELKKVKIHKPVPKGWHQYFKDIIKGKGTPRTNYYVLCLACDIYLIKRSSALLRGKNKARQRRHQAKRSAGYSGSLGGPGGILAALLQSQNGDQTHGSGASIPGALNQLRALQKNGK